jgi:hypothetical protein
MSRLLDAPEVVLGRATCTLTELLEREMDAIFKDLLEVVVDAAPSLERQRAVAANRIVLICRSLAHEVRRYEHVRWLCEHSDCSGDGPYGPDF